MKKQIISMFAGVCTVLVLSSASCGGSEEAAESPDGSAEKSAVAATADDGPNCLSFLNCDLPECHLFLATRHEISETKFNTMVNAFHNPAPPPKVVTRAQIESMVNGVDCQNNHIQFSGNETNTTSNDDINLQVVPGKEFEGKYSIGYLRGVLAKYPNMEELHFHKAVSDAGVHTLAFKVVGGGETINYADLTELYP